MTPEEARAEAWTWSFSRFSKFIECPEAYRLQYFDKLKIPPLSEMPFFQGRVQHVLGDRTFQRLQKGEVASFAAAREELEVVFWEFADGMPWRDEMHVHQAYAEAREMLEHYIELFHQFGLHQGEVYCEYKFGTYANPLLRPSGLRWVGSIDWLKVDKDQGKAWVYDAKTSQSMRYLDRRQLTMYAMSVEQTFGVTVEEVGYFMLRTEKPKLYTVTQAEKEALEAEMIHASMRAESGALRTEPSIQKCGNCQFSTGHCGVFKGWIMDGGMQSGEVAW